MIIPSPINGIEPKIHETAFIAPTAVIIGDVTIGEGTNIWFGAVLRGDFGKIIVGKNTSIQENVAIHCTPAQSAKIGSHCIIAHGAVIHGPCEIGDGCLVGMGANVIHNSILGEGSLLAAGAVLTNKEIPPNSMVVGIPAEVKRQIKNRAGVQGAMGYVKNGKLFKEFFEKHPEYLKSL